MSPALRAAPAVAAALTLPLAGLAVLLAVPDLDMAWQDHRAHFWLVLAAGACSAVLAYATGVAARRRGDAQIFLVSLAFLAAAGFLGLHALATPDVLLETPNAGFAIATPVGLLIAACFAAASAAPLTRSHRVAVMHNAGRLQGGLLVLMAAWAVASLLRLPPLDAAAMPERASGPLVSIAIPAIGLYAIAVGRYGVLYRKRSSALRLVMAAAFVLLAEATVATAFARNWHASWWEWHVLMLTAFALVALVAHRQWHEERFSDLYLEETVAGTRDISVLFADLAGFTSFSEQHTPREVGEMLNAYFERAIPPIVERHGGEVDNIIGDALMVVFNRRGDQPDHAERAARAALELRRTTTEVADAHPGWPRFRVGVNTGEVVMTVLGAHGGRTHTAIGDAVNVASRLEGAAPVGGIAIAGETLRRLNGARSEPLGLLEVKGKLAPVEAHELLALPSAE